MDKSCMAAGVLCSHSSSASEVLINIAAPTEDL